MTIDNCKLPQTKANPSEYDKLLALGERQKYILCRIQSAQRVVEVLSMEISKDSVEAGTLTRATARSFREIEMAYLLDSRKSIAIQGQKVSQADILGPVEPIIEKLIPVAYKLYPTQGWQPVDVEQSWPVSEITGAKNIVLQLKDGGLGKRSVLPCSIKFEDETVWIATHTNDRP